jgi:hypothetical protein
MIAMNRYLKTALTSLFAVSLLAGGTYASGKDKGSGPIERHKIDRNSTGSIHINHFMSTGAIGAWQTGKVTVVSVSTLNDVDPNRTMLLNRMKTNPDEVAALQSTIQNNPALQAQLEPRNVQLENIVAAVKATDGSVTFYVK